MKVKNIMFSGFMAAVLAGACGAADAATVLASKEFVTTELGKKQDTLQQGDNIVIEGNKISAVQYDATALTQKVADLETTIGASEEALGDKTIVQYIDDKTKGFVSDGVVSELQTDVETLQNAMGELPEGKTVAEAIAAAVYDDTALAGRVSANEADIAANSQAITGLETNKADKSALDALTAEGGKIAVLESTVATHTTDIAGLNTALGEKAAASDVQSLQTTVNGLAEKAVTTDNMDTALAGYVTSTELNGKGYQTAENVATAIENADIEMSQVTGLNTALDGKAAASVVQSLQTTVEGFTNETTGIAATYATKSEFNTYKGEVADALDGKVDDAALNNYYTKSEADTQFLEDAGLENGAAYLVTKDATTGKVVYQEVAVVASNGTDMMIGRAQ